MGTNADYYKHGDPNAICERCGHKYKRSQLRKTWDGLDVCPYDFEHRHPQDFLRAKEDRQAIEDPSPESPDSFLNVGDVTEEDL